MDSLEQITTENKSSMLDHLQNMVKYIETSVQQGTAAHDVEKSILHSVLQLGYQLMVLYFQLLGTGDQGETLTLPDDRVLNRDVPLSYR